MLNPLLTKLVDSLREDFGNPIGLRKLIAEMPHLRVRVDDIPAVIAEPSVVHWHEWSSFDTDRWPRGATGRLNGWKMYGGQYASDSREIEPLKQLCIRTVHEDFACDIQSVTGLAASKSELYDYPSLRDMALDRCDYLIQDMSREGLDRNMRWPEVRIVNDNSPDFFVKYAWDQGLYLINSGGSHHFAAAHFIASELQANYMLCGRLVTLEMNRSAIADLNAEYAIFAVSDDLYGSNGFHDCMRNFKAEYYWQDLPRPYAESRAIFLPRSQPRSAKVADVLRDEGFTDVGAVLTELASPHAAKNRNERQAVMRERLDALPALLAGAGTAYVFAQKAVEAGRDRPLAQVDWQVVERATIQECIAIHGQDPADVLQALVRHSPAITSPQAVKTLAATIEGYAALHQLIATQEYGADEFSPR
ncbi:DUF6685 family protein [Pseudomonas savastanoi]|uniref:DUF6685 family protein n=1 Tax=Pseudomonas savastanoi TaxID=29438 RepID=UPI001786B1DA|nr:DUF6685 family protein [Pseudomonas savastanoi]QOI07927.1 hypothetical protein D5S10_29835 [Pseudomonas savastanoi]